MSPLEELSLLLAAKGVPPEMVAAVVTRLEAAGDRITSLVDSTINRNLAEELRAKTTAARELLDLAARPDLLNTDMTGVWQAKALALLGNVADLVKFITENEEETEPETSPN